MKKNIISICLGCLIMLMSYFPMVNAKEEQEKKEKEESKIVIIERSLNFAWGYYDTGIFIDDKGNMYEFNFSDDYGYDDDISDIPDGDSLLEELYAIMEKEEPIGKVSGIGVILCDMSADMIDENSRLVEEHYACDAGQKTLYVVDDEEHIIEVSSEGDYIVYREDNHAFLIDFLYEYVIK